MTECPWPGECDGDATETVTDGSVTGEFCERHAKRLRNGEPFSTRRGAGDVAEVLEEVLRA
ncbi:hypothetical protein [Halobaculum sp. P14]|uniref:hypothetical protein n=1 Tax=Halobaculum sp. P14 TaxID=3421638 RepID=UPI003EBCAB96